MYDPLTFSPGMVEQLKTKQYGVDSRHHLRARLIAFSLLYIPLTAGMISSQISGPFVVQISRVIWHRAY